MCRNECFRKVALSKRIMTNLLRDFLISILTLGRCVRSCLFSFLLTFSVAESLLHLLHLSPHRHSLHPLLFHCSVRAVLPLDLNVLVRPLSVSSLTLPSSQVAHSTPPLSHLLLLCLHLYASIRFCTISQNSKVNVWMERRGRRWWGQKYTIPAVYSSCHTLCMRIYYI